LTSLLKKNFFAFGLSIASDWDIPCSQSRHASFCSIQLIQGTEKFFLSNVPVELRAADSKRIHFHTLEDGSRYILWRDNFEFHLSPDSRTVTGLSMDGNPEAALKTYMLGHLLSFVLLGLGKETIHAASIVTGNQAFALVGDSARGKSTLSAAFLQAGYTLLSDDFLVVSPHGDSYIAYPGIPRIKLYERVAKHLIAEGKQGTPMTTHRRTKMVYPVQGVPTEPVPLRTFYALASPKNLAGLKGVRIETLSEKEAYLELTENSFNVSVRTPERLASQFQWATALVKKVPVKRLSYPRVMEILPDVIAAVKEDLASAQAEASPKAFASTLPTRTP
jgi:hypothetical protein